MICKLNTLRQLMGEVFFLILLTSVSGAGGYPSGNFGSGWSFSIF